MPQHVTSRYLNRHTYRVLTRSVRKELRRRFGRIVIVSIGSYGIKQGVRGTLSFISYRVLDEEEGFAALDLDTQQARDTVAAIPSAVGVVAVYPAGEQVNRKHQVELASSVGFGLGHKSISEVEHLRYLWEPPLKDLLQQVNLQLHHVQTASPPAFILYLSPLGHALLGIETAEHLRATYPDTIICVITVIPHDPESRKHFAAFIRQLACSNAVDYIILTDNGRLGHDIDAQHDDAVNHMLGANFQAARPTGANPINVLADSTISFTAADDGQEGAPRRTRILTFTFLQERIAVEPPPHVCWIRRVSGTPIEPPQTSSAVLLQRGEGLAYQLATGRGILAGPLPLATDTRTSIVLGLPSNDAATFPSLVSELKARFESRRVVDPNLVHFLVGRLTVPVASVADGAPLTAVRIGEMSGSLDDLVQTLNGA